MTGTPAVRSPERTSVSLPLVSPVTICTDLGFPSAPTTQTVWVAPAAIVALRSADWRRCGRKEIAPVIPPDSVLLADALADGGVKRSAALGPRRTLRLSDVTIRTAWRRGGEE